MSVLNGFLGCIGYKTMDKAVLIACGEETYHEPWTARFWMFFLPAVPIGTCMYFMKKHHIGKPILVLPFFLFVAVLMLGRPQPDGSIGYVVPGSAAEEAGFRSGDVVVGVLGDRWDNIVGMLC